MKNLNPTIIHMSQRTDREKFINDIKDYFPNAKVFNAITAKNANMLNENCDFGAGCSASQLMAIHESNKDEPLLVLEDDAVLDKKKYKQFLALGNPPEDCAVILLGGDKLSKTKESWTEVNETFCGGHAIVYMPIIHKTKFLENFWRYLFFFPKEGPDSWITEAILRIVVKSINLKIYRPKVLPFTAAESFSDRTKQSFSRNNQEI
jgi:hypothetical protein